MTARWRGPQDAELMLKELQAMPLGVRPIPNSLVMEAARLKAVYGLSHADAFAVATALREKAPLVTGDPEMKPLATAGVIKLDWVRTED